MTSDFTPFLQQTYPMPLLQYRVNIILALTRYATSSWRNLYTGKMEPGASAYTTAVEAVCTYHFFNHFDVPKRAQKSMRQPGDTTELVLKAFAHVISDLELETIEFGTPHFGNEDLGKAFSECFGTQVISLGTEAHPSVAGAYVQALDNYRQARTRLLAYTSIFHLTRSNEFNDADSRIICSDLRLHLWERANHFMQDALVFGGLLGGEAHQQILKLAARNMCHKEDAKDVQFSVIQFLQPDGRVPGFSLEKTSKLLADDIKAKYDAL